MKLTANWRIKLDGKRIEAGESFDPGEHAGELLASGAASDPKTKKMESGSKDAASGSSGEGGGELSQEQRNAKIRKELETMLAEDPKQENNLLWTQAGDPRNKTLDQRCGFNVKNEEVTPIWAELKPKGEE